MNDYAQKFTDQVAGVDLRAHPLYRTPDQLRIYGQQKTAPSPIIPVVTLNRHRLMFRKRTVFIVAAGGTGKTLWNRRLTYHLSRGEKFGGFASNRDDGKREQANLRIVNFLGEDDDDSLKESIWHMTEGQPAGDWFNFPMAGNKLTLMENDGKGNLTHSQEYLVVRQILLDIVEQSGPLDIVTFDTLARFFGLPGASFDSEVAQTWMTQVAEKIANEFDCVVIVYAHTQKGTKELHADMLRGASGWRDAARLVCGMVPLSENDALLADIENEEDRRCFIKLGIVKTNSTKSTFPFQYYRIFSTKGDTGDIEPAQLLQDRIERMKMHFLFLIKDKEVSTAELERGTTETAKAVNKEMVRVFPSYKQTKDPKRLVVALKEEDMASEVESRTNNNGRAKLVIRLSDLAKRIENDGRME